jgi:hypothetical protein
MPVKPGTMAMRMDFSTGSDLIRLSTDTEELFFFKVESGDVITAPLDVRDVKWETDTCPFTWFSQGKS